MTTNPIIEVKNLQKSFGELEVLKGINTEVQRGEVVVVIGPSGSGKSTFLRCLNLMETPTGGSIFVDGVEITDPKCDINLHRQKMGMVFQHFNLFNNMTILRNMTLAPMALLKKSRAEAEEKALALLRRVGLEDKANAYPAQLSGGQKQRVALARALATEPDVLLCDEATSALDPTTTASILALLKELNRTLGVTVVIITHQMSVIEEVCSRVAILDGGKVAEAGAVEDIFRNPRTDAARRLVYPAGIPEVHTLRGSKVIRVSFDGGTAYQPLIASLAIDCGVKANILGADTRNIDGKAFGTMLLGLPDDPNEAAKALSYIRSQPNVSAEEVEYHG